MNILNIGCGSLIFEGAINMDRTPVDNRVKIGDADNLLNFMAQENISEKFDIILSISPFGYKLILSDIHQILKRNGKLIIVGTYNNPYFSFFWDMSEEEIRDNGFKLELKTDDCQKEFRKSKNTKGNNPLNGLKQVNLIKR